jgi:hypothetical protein
MTPPDTAARKSALPRLPRRFSTPCPRCQVDIELSLDWHTRLTYSHSGTKGWLSVEVGASATEHTCEDDR